MGLRRPRPIQAVKSLFTAASGDGPALYRIRYELDSGKTGALVWIDSPGRQPQLVTNSYEFYLPEGKTFIVDENLLTKIKGERVPVHELVGIDGNAPSEAETVEIPEQFVGQTIPPADRKDELFHL